MKPNPRLLVLAASLLAPFGLQAADAVPGNGAAAAEKPEAAPEPYQLKNRSSFTPPPKGTRAPFWPIGWMPREGVVAKVEAGEAPKLDEKAFRVTSILLGSGSAPSLAVINGRAYGEGESLKMPRGAAPAGTPGTPAPRIRVQQISDGSVVLQFAGQTVTVPLHRPELALKKVQEELLLDEDR